MSGWDWFWSVVMVLLIGWQVVELLGPFELEDAERPVDATPGRGGPSVVVGLAPASA